MKKKQFTYQFGLLLLLVFIGMGSMNGYAQKALQRRQGISRDSLQRQIIPRDSLFLTTDSIEQRNQKQLKELEAPVDTTALILKDTTQQELTIQKERFVPNPNRAVWMALVIPGAGQIYNRKYWKLPIVYGGFIGCLYAFNWNSQMYKDYRQGYLDIMDSDPNTKSYEDFFRPGYDFEKNKEYITEVFKKRKDRYRRWRDLSVFAFVAVYALSVIDAYVDAQLSNFDISDDINMTVNPQLMRSGGAIGSDGNYYGLNCNITF